MDSDLSKEESDGIEFGWRAHGALDSWTGRVDTKASIALAIESAIFGFVVTLSRKDAIFYDVTGTSEHFFYLGLGLLIAAAFFALAVVVPQLNRWRSRKSEALWKTNTIYFGHLRHWDPKDLERALRSQPNPERQLATQMVAMSRIAWRKHGLLQISLLLLASSIISLLSAAIAA